MESTCKYVHKQLWTAWSLGKELTDLHHKIISMLQAGTKELVYGQILYSYLHYEERT